MRNRTISFVLACALASVACGDSPPPPAAAPPSPPVAPTPPPVAAPAPPTAPAATVAAAPAPPPIPQEDRPAAQAITVPPELQKIVDAADRSPQDKAMDAGRHPGETLAFLGVKPGMKIVDLGAGTGYTTELLSRAVGPKGKVYSVNPKTVPKPLAEIYAARIKGLKNVVHIERDLDEPLPADVKNLDAAVFIMLYHDTVYWGADRDKMNKAMLAALKPGAPYVVIDHNARPGEGTTVAKTNHRIEEKVVKDEVAKAGFKFDSEGFFLRNPDDARDWSASPGEAKERRGTSDRFVLKFKK